MLDTSSATAADEAWQLSRAWLPESGESAEVSRADCVEALAGRFLASLSFHMAIEMEFSLSARRCEFQDS